MPANRLNAKTLARSLVGTHCPHFDFDRRRVWKANRRHNTTRNTNTVALARALKARGLRIIGIAGLGGREPLVEAVIAGKTVRGRPDALILAVDPSRRHGVIALLEAKSKRPSRDALDTLAQASVYAVPLIPCLYSGCTARVARGRMVVKTRTGRVLASLKPPVTAAVNVRRVLVYLAGPQGLGDYTWKALSLASVLASLKAVPPQQGPARVPGPWCTYCKHFNDGTCAAGLLVREK